MPSNNHSSATTTNLQVHDNEQNRISTQRDAMRNATQAGKEIPASKYAGDPNSINTGIAAAQPSQLRPVRVQPVDRKTLEGSTPGDFRSNPGDVAKASLDRAADNGGPRQPMRGARTQKSYDENASPTFQSFPTPDSGD